MTALAGKAWQHLLDSWPGLKLLVRIAREQRRPSASPHAPYWSIETTDACNARCVFCTYPVKQVSGRPLELGALVRFLDWATSRGVKTLQFTPLTGESFADPGLLEKLQLASERGFDIFLFTNGSLLHQVDLDRLLDCRITDLRISFGGFSREAYVASFGVDLYDQVVANLEQLMQVVERRGALHSRVPRVELSFRSVRHLDLELASPDYMRTLKRHVDEGRLEVTYLDAYDSFAGWLGELPGAMRLSNMPRMLWLKRHYPCWFLGSIGLGSRGQVRLCNCVMSESADGHSDLVVGSIEDDPAQIEARVLDKRRNWRRGQIPASCQRCQNYHPTVAQ